MKYCAVCSLLRSQTGECRWAKGEIRLAMNWYDNYGSVFYHSNCHTVFYLFLTRVYPLLSLSFVDPDA